MKKRYLKNMNMLSEEECYRLKESKVCVVGCGGLGGYVAEMLARIGVGSITCIDGDSFDESNLNRQLFCLEESLGRKKIHGALKRLKQVNSEIEVSGIESMIGEDNCRELIKGHDVVVDALDCVKSRMILQKWCEKENIPLVHGAIGGWYGQVTTIFPGDKTLNLIYKNGGLKGVEEDLGNPSFTPAVIGGLQVGEVVKVLLRRLGVLRRKILFVDILNNDFQCIDLN